MIIVPLTHHVIGYNSAANPFLFERYVSPFTPLLLHIYIFLDTGQHSRKLCFVAIWTTTYFKSSKNTRAANRLWYSAIQETLQCDSQGMVQIAATVSNEFWIDTVCARVLSTYARGTFPATNTSKRQASGVAQQPNLPLD